MPVIALLHSKGGVSKTTSAIHIARELQKRKYRVLLVDSDPQRSALDWSSATEGEYFSVIGMDRPVLEAEVLKLAPDYDWIIIDGAAKVEKMLLSAIKAADLVIMPIRPSALDIWPLVDLVEMIKTRQDLTDGRPSAAFLIGQAVKGTILGKDVIEAVQQYDIPIFNTMIHFKQSYAKGISMGKTALEIDGSARVEISNLVDEIEEAFK
jgi:chromosome partitioning protein